MVSTARTLGHARVIASHLPGDPASARVLEKAGFRPTTEACSRLAARSAARPAAPTFMLDLRASIYADCGMTRRCWQHRSDQAVAGVVHAGAARAFAASRSAIVGGVGWRIRRGQPARNDPPARGAAADRSDAGAAGLRRARSLNSDPRLEFARLSRSRRIASAPRELASSRIRCRRPLPGVTGSAFLPPGLDRNTQRVPAIRACRHRHL
jgi:hypothetical protein